MSETAARTRILFVCTGNICRSPTAEGVFRHMAEAAGLADRLAVDSCGLGGWHVGSPPTREAQAAAGRRGYDLSALRARQFDPADYTRFDLLLAMDGGHFAALDRGRPPGPHAAVHHFLEAAPDAGRDDVPDPYYAGGAAYDHALDLIEAGCRGWLDRLARRPGAHAG